MKAFDRFLHICGNLTVDAQVGTAYDSSVKFL